MSPKRPYTDQLLTSSQYLFTYCFILIFLLGKSKANSFGKSSRIRILN